jgi:hypothetical protein
MNNLLSMECVAELVHVFAVLKAGIIWWTPVKHFAWDIWSHIIVTSI